MKKILVRICSVCGKECGTKSHEFIHGMCCKHYKQYKKYGYTLDTNPRTVWDANEVRVFNSYAEIDTYTNTGEVLNTFKIDKEDVSLLGTHKWRTVFKGKQKAPYLVTGHAGSQGGNLVYFHRLVMNNPDEEIDHINRDSTDNRKCNLRLSNRLEQLANTRLRCDNTQGVKGVYYIQRDNRYRAEIQKGSTHIYSPTYKTKEEASYCRLKLEELFFNREIFNVPLLENLANSITLEQRESINKYILSISKERV